ncbi:hypothetical protein Bbelb_217940 [Branchiostoma belcheri]|nr:hypothetical protein Bbelb_217940 [Branchiostoma belcheri]
MFIIQVKVQCKSVPGTAASKTNRACRARLSCTSHERLPAVNVLMFIFQVEVQCKPDQKRLYQPREALPSQIRRERLKLQIVWQKRTRAQESSVQLSRQQIQL